MELTRYQCRKCGELCDIFTTKYVIRFNKEDGTETQWAIRTCRACGIKWMTKEYVLSKPYVTQKPR